MAGKMARDIKTFEARVKTDADKVMESFLFGLYGEIIRRTPVAAVNGGRARGSWEMGTKFATNRSVDGPKNKSGAARPPSGLAGMARKSDRVPVYISSAIPYIVPLEHGHSKIQAPHGMVQQSIAHTVAQFRKGK